MACRIIITPTLIPDFKSIKVEVPKFDKKPVFLLKGLY